MGIAHKSCLGLRPKVTKASVSVTKTPSKQYTFPKSPIGNKPNYKQADPSVAYDIDMKG